MPVCIGTIAEVSLKDQMRDLLPMLAVLLIVLLIITYIPETVTFFAESDRISLLFKIFALTNSTKLPIMSST